MSHTGDDERSSAAGKRAVKTTIVGGQSQDNRRPLPPIPIGIEQLLSIAAVSREFAAELVRDRDAAIEAASIELTSTERRILAAVDDRALRRMIASAEGSVPDRERRAFLTRSAAALLVLAGGAAVGGASACGDKETVPASAPQPPKPPPGPQPVPAGVRPDRPEPPQPPQAPPDAGAPDAGTPTIRKGPRPTRGIRPDRPIAPLKPAAGGGARPERPLEHKTRGIRPDRPGDDEAL